MPPPDAKKVIQAKRQKNKGNRTGKKNLFIAGKQKFYFRFKMTDPADPSKLIDFPKGVRARLMDNGNPLADVGADVLTDEKGSVCLTASSQTAKRRPSYHFRLDSDVRLFYDIDKKELVSGKTIKPDDKRNLMELPMVVDTRDGGFFYDQAKLPLVDGMLKQYDSLKKGEGGPDAPIELEVRFYWFYLTFKYFDRIRREWKEVPRGMPVNARVGTEWNPDRYLKTPALLGYNLTALAARAQHYLNLLGFRTGLPDGKLAGTTLNALKAFQKLHGIKSAGAADKQTLIALEQLFNRPRFGVWKEDIKAYGISVWCKKDGLKPLFFEMAPPRPALVTADELSRHDLFLYTKDKSATPVLVTRADIEKNEKKAYRKLHFLKARKYYDLPVQWSSRNYWTRYDNDMTKGGRYEKVMKDTKGFYPFVADLTKRAPITTSLTFSFDDVVLAQTNRSQVVQDQQPNGTALALDAASRFTLFYVDHDATENVGGTMKNRRRLAIHKPRADEPVFTDAPFTANLIHDVPGHTRLVYFCNRFFDVFNRRSTAADPDFDKSKHLLGARLAIHNDPRVHAEKKVVASDANDLARVYALSQCGHYELHYLHDCGTLDGKPLSYLLIYWSTRFTTVATDPWGKAVTAGTAADVTNHRKVGMVEGMNRLNKDYLIERSRGKKNLLIRPFHFMEAKNDTNGGPHKALTNVVGNNDGAWMMINDAQLRKRDYQSDPTYFGAADPDNAYQDTDGKTYAVLTNHHEFGHATGCWDMYLYKYTDAASNNWWLPRYDQPYTAIGGPYSCDKIGRMNTNRTPRMRQFWRYVNWLHDASQPGQPLEKFLGGTRLRISFNGSAIGHVHKFELADAYKNHEVAAFSAMNHALAPNVTADLLLYKLGDDELAHLLKPGQVFDAILNIRLKFAMEFINVGASAWNFAAKRSWTERLFNHVKTALNDKFRITCPDVGYAFRNVYVYCVPHVKDYAGAAPGDSHVNVRTTFRFGNNWVINGKEIQTDYGDQPAPPAVVFPDARILRRGLGLADTAGNPAPTKNDFGTIVTWLKGAVPAVSGGQPNYTVHDL